MKSNDIVIIDCEASGLSEKSYPIEIGVAFKDDSFSFLIKPLDSWNDWDEKSAKIHKIERDELFINGITVYDAAYRLNSQLRGLTVYSDAADFETFWIDKLFSSVGISRNFDIESIYSLNFDPNKYMIAKKDLSLKSVIHRAENDAIIIRDSILRSL
jgi:hypothetical protein